MVRSPSRSLKSGGEGEGESQKRESEEYDPPVDVEGLTKSVASCKWFNVAKGFGFVTLSDLPPKVPGEKEHPDIFVYQTAIKMKGFRSLREGEEVEVWYKTSVKGLEAVKVSGPGDTDCSGSEKRPRRGKKGADRCYNCDECGHHIKECSHPALPKKCHHCKSVYHLVANCPLKDRGGAKSQQTQSTTDDKYQHHHQGDHGDDYQASQYQQHQEEAQQEIHHRHGDEQEILPQETDHSTSQPQATSAIQTQIRYS